MIKYYLKITFSIIIAGVFIIVAFIGYNYQSLNSSAYVILYLLITFIFLFGFAAGQNIAMPVKKLLESTDNLSKGDLKIRVQLHSKDEFEQISNSFNKIADEFEKIKSEIETSKKSADIKMKTKTLITEQIINALEQKVKNRTLELQKVIADSEKFQNDLKAKEAKIAELESKIKIPKKKEKST